MYQNDQCPLCNEHGKKAKPKMIQPIIKKDLKHLIVDDLYYLCEASSCEVVAFNENKDCIFLLRDVILNKNEIESNTDCCKSSCGSGSGGCCKK
ncbi:hypothetical protein RH915_04520 [Serpentinicella sp. ANB-PHB4]|uniref:hypothetical protein n=1 Tax=Serpentinicella sp. ANB-PHB4 TaxID=3074076 RepID=UPI00285F2FCD|nr:hypothetical protein [Serpentinicella sp. ANB-PHB4]MDR5658747.1 hypothetical protein [Serpentinicella sp. ANB-PHB4]